jgi:hypothetical protein
MIRNVSLVNGQTDRLALPYSGYTYVDLITWIPQLQYTLHALCPSTMQAKLDSKFVLFLTTGNFGVTTENGDIDERELAAALAEASTYYIAAAGTHVKRVISCDCLASGSICMKIVVEKWTL